MDATPRLQLPYIAPQQAQKQVTYNEAMLALDQLVQPVVLSRSTGTPPATPATGDCYLVGPAASGAWTGQEDRLACLVDGVWRFRTALEGWQLYVADSGELVIRRGGAWDVFFSPGGTALPSFGINATADLYNRLAVAAAASLFTHDGAGHRLAINKAAPADTASMVFQTAYGGRAEFGLAGDDDFHVKVSADGTAWHEAMVIAGASGLVRLPQGQLGFPASPNPSADPHVLDHYEEGSWSPALSFGGATSGIAYGALNLGRYTRIGRLCVASGTLQLTSKGTATGEALLTGLPFVSSAAQLGASCPIGHAAGLALVSGPVTGLQRFDSATIGLFQSGSGNAVALDDTNFTATSELSFSAAYEVA